jgi:High-affinity nickel-transport protein
MDSTVATALAGGFVLGLQHALDPDHLVAVSTIVSDHKSLRRSSMIGTFWGLGHSLSLLGIGLAIIILRVSIPDHFLPFMEAPVHAVGSEQDPFDRSGSGLYGCIRGWIYRRDADHELGNKRAVYTDRSALRSDQRLDSFMRRRVQRVFCIANRVGASPPVLEAWFVASTSAT